MKAYQETRIKPTNHRTIVLNSFQNSDFASFFLAEPGT
ncbi:hypothetical protein LEP1GSC061_3864 [Leptospira wolffii serovar Khorat str. Khorat-H2]|nr:hypothetical protein LEP1GSC061_3864 [Leptospira wolffii serovar Khorat str. Khorat-H2]